MKGLSVIIPSKNATNLLACIKGVVENDPEVRIVVVDDGLSFGAFEQMDAHLLCDMVPGVKPFCFARNVNIGIRASGDDDVVLLNDDAILQTPGGFTFMQKCSYVHQDYGIIGSTTNVTNQPLQQPRGVGLRQVPDFAFVCVLIPRRTIEHEKIGVLDERYSIDYGVEDRDYCETVTRAGLKVGVHDGCFVDHASLFSSFRGDPLASKDFSKNYALFRAKFNL